MTEDRSCGDVDPGHSIGIRRVDEHDLDQVIELIKESTNNTTSITKEDLQVDLFSHDPAKRLNTHSNNDNDATNKSLRSNKTIAQMLVAVRYPNDPYVRTLQENDSSIIGYACFHYFYTPWVGTCMSIDDIYVKPEYRRRGTAKKIFSELKGICEMEGLKSLVVNVDRSRVSNFQKIVKGLLERGFQSKRDDKTDWSVFKFYV